MAANITPVQINPANPAFPTKKMIGLGKDGKEFSDTLDFFKDSISDEWWTFYESMTIPKFFQDEAVYSFGIKSVYTCTGNNSELKSYKEEYLRIGLERVFTYFNKSFDQETIDFFVTEKNAEGKIVSKVTDYHLDSQPLSKLKFLIEVDARYLNALPNNPEPSSFIDNRDEQGNLIIAEGFLNPTVPENYVSSQAQQDVLKQLLDEGASYINETDDGELISTSQLVNDKNIFIVNLKSDAYEREIEKTSYYMLQWHKDILSSNITLNGVDLRRESKYLREASFLISSFVRSNFSNDGYSTGRNVSAATIARQNFNSNYDIRIAFSKDDVPDFPEFNIEWISVNFNDGRGDKLLDVGFKRLINSHPLDGQATIQYLYNHQRILAGFDLGFELTAIEFLQHYHYPLTLDLFGNLPLNSQKDAPFGNQQYSGTPKFKLEQDPDRDYTRAKKTCGIEYPGEFNFNPDWIGLLRNFLSPVNYSIGFEVQFFSIGPPCPAPATSIATTKIKPYWKKEWNNFIKRIAKKDKNISKLSERWSESVKDVSSYYTTDEFYKDAKKRAGQMAGNLELTLRKAQDIIMGKFTLDKMLQAVCICVTQLADQLIEEHVPNSDKLKMPTSFSVGTSLGGGFDPMTVVEQLADEDSKFELSDAFTGSGILSDTFAFPESLYDAQMEPLKLQKLCSFCIFLPDFMVRLPTFDLLKALLDLLLRIIEALLAYLIMQLLFSLMAWLLKCPDYSCETRPAGAPVNDYGSLDLPQFFPNAPDGSGEPLDLPILADCPALLIPEDAFEGTQLQDIQNLLFERISTEFSSGQLMNIMEGYATDFSINTIQEIIMMESEFEQIRPFFEKGTRRKIEAFIDCIFENVDPAKIDEFGAPTQEVSYCPTIDNTPAAILANKCDNQDQVEKFLNREKFSQYSRIKGLINEFRENPNLLGDLLPEIFPSEDADGEKKAGLFSDPKFKPAVATTMIEQLNPMIDGVNSLGVKESPEVLRQLYVDGYPNSAMPSDKDNQIASTLQLSTAMVMLLSPLPALAFITAPFSDISEKKLDSKYPIVGGPFAKPALESASQLINFFTQTPIQGSNSAFSELTIPNKSLRQFNSSLKMTSGIVVDGKVEKDENNSTDLRVYFESVTNALAADPEPFSNNIIIDVNSEYKNKNGNFSSDSITYSFRAPLDYNDDGDLEILNPISDIGLETFNSLSYTENDYSPQGKVFAYLIETGLGEIFDNLDDTTKVEANREFAGRFHMRAFTDMVRVFSFAAAESPFFRTYTYEELESGVGSEGMKTKSFRRFGRRDPYFDVTLGPGPMFKQKFKADDSGGRTDVYWKPTPAMNDTPMRRGVYNDGCEIEFIDRTKMKENIINNYDWADAQGGLDDPESLTNLNKAVLDELIPEMIKFYCIDACIKAMPVNKIFKNYGVESANEEVFTALIVNRIIDELSISSLMPSKGGPIGIRSFPNQLIKYWDRKFTKYEKEEEEKPSFLTGYPRPATMEVAVKYLVQEHLAGAMETASKLTQIKHLSDEDQAADVAIEKVFTFSPDSEGGSVFILPEFLPTLDVLSGLPVSKFSNFFNSSGNSKYVSLSNGNFIFESYIKIFLHDETIEWLKQYPKGSDLVNIVHDTPLSLRDLEEIDMTTFLLGAGLDVADLNPAIQLMDFLSERVLLEDSFTGSGLEFGTTGFLAPDGEDAKNSLFSYVGEPNKALFKDLKYYVRLSYVHTGAENSEEIFQQFYADGKNESSKAAIMKNKALIYRELPVNSPLFTDAESNRVVVLPLMEKEYDGDERLRKTTNALGQGTWSTDTSDSIESEEIEFLNQQANYYYGSFTTSPNAFLAFMIKHFAAYLQYDYNRKIPNKVELSNKEIVETIKEYKQMLKPQDAVFEFNFEAMPFFYATGEGTEDDPYEHFVPKAEGGVFKGPGELTVEEYKQKFAKREAEIDLIREGKSSFGNNYVDVKGLRAYLFETKFSRKKLFEDFAKLPEWKALFGYALPQSIASNIVAVFAYLNIIKGLASENKFSYSKTKNLLTIFYIAAVSRSDFSGKSNQSDAMANQDYSSFEEMEGDEMQDPNDANPDSNKTPGDGDGAEPVCDD